MVYSSVGYCDCGEEIWIEYLNTGNTWICRFSHNSSPEIFHCPSCGKELREEDLSSR